MTPSPLSDSYLIISVFEGAARRENRSRYLRMIFERASVSAAASATGLIVGRFSIEMSQ